MCCSALLYFASNTDFVVQNLQELVGELPELCPSADRMSWEASPFVSLPVYKVQVLADEQLQET